MTYPFTSDNGVLLKGKYSLHLDLLEQINATFSFKEKSEFISLYITEGVPFAFKSNPLVFEDIRSWLGKHLNIDAKNITITGSSRVGFSLNPNKWGKPYQSSSDLDLIVISKKIFEEYKNDFKLFTSDIKQRIIRRERINALDLNNIETIKNSILKHKFIDQAKIPVNRRYQVIYKSYDLLAHLLNRMKITKNCPKPTKATFRVYETWEACIEQLNKNISNASRFKGDNIILENVEINPSFPGGHVAWQDFLKKNLNTKVISAKGAKKGTYTVRVKFLVYKDGTLGNFLCERDMGFGMCEEAIRVIQKKRYWIPGIQKGRNVNCFSRMDITFHLD